jgi:hypothetical protein
MSDADRAFVYYNPQVIEHKRLAPIVPKQVKAAFGGKNLTVFTNSEKLKNELKNTDLQNAVLLMMSSGNFDGIENKNFYGIVETPFRLITKKGIIPCEDETLRNNRARSARLRIAEKI